ncbi:hypothetical protein BV22DRAFT_1052456 [Leucogyrophana mollusca]|uniref:Uncharacterized protein n=1 Tax=Leucogyrophana mollusca TaxID=85980 RepID=A0ACB8AWP7_9AGAM|nr:hypothetical protein BV22DRAFT_1052456 [Leucogyrophana mollusca]
MNVSDPPSMNEQRESIPWTINSLTRNRIHPKFHRECGILVRKWIVRERLRGAGPVYGDRSRHSRCTCVLRVIGEILKFIVYIDLLRVPGDALAAGRDTQQEDASNTPGAPKLDLTGPHAPNISNLALCPSLPGFNFVKLHVAQHYAEVIRLLGTTDNCNMEATERLHIDYAKDTYDLTNKKAVHTQPAQQSNEYSISNKRSMAEQSCTVPVCTAVHWIKAVHTSAYCRWWHGKSPMPLVRHKHRLHPPGQQLVKHPSTHQVPFKVLADAFRAKSFMAALKTFIAGYRYTHSLSCNRQENVTLAITGVDVWHKIKFHVPNPQTDTKPAVGHIAHAEPQRPQPKGARGSLVARFDTVLVNKHEMGEIGMEGKRVTQLRVIFKLPEKYSAQLFRKDAPRFLAYMDWFSRQ